MILSVIMSVYNNEKYLCDAMNSIATQTFSDYEFLITNDGSTDNTKSILEHYAKQDHRIHLINQANKGLTWSLNHMISLAKGDFIARMDADDISLPGRFEYQIKKMREHPEYLFTGCWIQTIDGNGLPQKEVVWPDRPNLLRKHLRIGHNCFAHGSIMMRKTVFKNIKYRFRYGQDYDLWLRLTETGNAGMVEKVLFQHRYHNDSISDSLYSCRKELIALMLTLHKERIQFQKEETSWQKQETHILKKASSLPKAERSKKSIFQNAIHFITNGQHKHARQELLKIIKCDGLKPRIYFLFFLSHLPVFFVKPLIRILKSFRNRRSYVREPTLNK